MNERIKKHIVTIFEELFLPVFIVTWAVGLGIFSVFVAISILWKIYNVF